MAASVAAAASAGVADRQQPGVRTDSGRARHVIGSLDTGYVRTPAIYAAYRKGAAGKGREATRARLAYMAMVGVGRAKEEGFLHDHVGRFGHLLMMEQGGHVTHEETVDNLTLFSREVLPRLGELGRPASLQDRLSSGIFRLAGRLFSRRRTSSTRDLLDIVDRIIGRGAGFPPASRCGLGMVSAGGRAQLRTTLQCRAKASASCTD
jgi:hypothetical protein